MDTVELLATATRPTDVYDFVREHESSARTYADAVDRVIERGHGSRVVDSEGREYLDFLACAGTLATGHNDPRVLSRVRDFLDSGHVLQALDMTTPVKHAFVSRLLANLPGRLAHDGKVQFCGPSGADAIEAAVKLFKTATGRRTVLAFHGAYHGMTAGSLALTGNLTAKRDVAALMPDVHFLPYPYPYRCPFGLGGEASWRTSLAYVERVLTDPESGITEPAVMVLEAIQGEGGVVPAPAPWLQGIRQLTAELGIPLLVDEVQTGFGRTGTMMAYEHAGIEPDAVVLSKAVGGGFPIAVLVYSRKYDSWRSGAHAGTFRGNQIAMVAGIATLDIIAEDGLVDSARRKGEHLAEELSALAARRPEIGDVRGRGLMWGLEIVDPTGQRDAVGALPADGAQARAIRRRCLENGLIVETGGRYGAVIRLLPPLTVTGAEIDEMLAKLELSLTEAAMQGGPGSGTVGAPLDLLERAGETVELP
jgi:diaminobutyrate-2-oxoglutarate transaminase